MMADYSGIHSEVRYYVPLNKTYEVWNLSVTKDVYKRQTVAHTKHSAFTMEKMCLRDWDAHRLPPRTSS